MPQIRELIDTHFSLQWCRENIVIPLGLKPTKTGSQRLTVAIGNFSYLATIGDFIKQRAAHAGLDCQFIEKPTHEIQALLDKASQERLVSGESNNLDGFEFSDDAILDALKGADEDSSNQGFDFDFDDSDEQIIEEQALDLSAEMMGTKSSKPLQRFTVSALDLGYSR